MNSFKKLIVILLIFVSQNANANWVFFYESQMFDAKLLLTSVQQKKQVTLALIAINYKEKQYFDGVSSQVIFLEHICGETNPTSQPDDRLPLLQRRHGALRTWSSRHHRHPQRTVAKRCGANLQRPRRRPPLHDHRAKR